MQANVAIGGVTIPKRFAMKHAIAIVSVLLVTGCKPGQDVASSTLRPAPADMSFVAWNGRIPRTYGSSVGLGHTKYVATVGPFYFVDPKAPVTEDPRMLGSSTRRPADGFKLEVHEASEKGTSLSSVVFVRYVPIEWVSPRLVEAKANEIVSFDETSSLVVFDLGTRKVLCKLGTFESNLNDQTAGYDPKKDEFKRIEEEESDVEEHLKEYRAHEFPKKNDKFAQLVDAMSLQVVRGTRTFSRADVVQLLGPADQMKRKSADDTDALLYFYQPSKEKNKWAFSIMFSAGKVVTIGTNDASAYDSSVYWEPYLERLGAPEHE